MRMAIWYINRYEMAIVASTHIREQINDETINRRTYHDKTPLNSFTHRYIQAQQSKEAAPFAISLFPLEASFLGVDLNIIP